MLAHGRECSLNGSGRNMLSRILHVGHSGLAEEEWGMDNSLLYTEIPGQPQRQPLSADFFRKSRFADVDVPF